AVYANGAFTIVGGLDRRAIAAIDSTGLTMAWNPGQEWAATSMLGIHNTLVYAQVMLLQGTSWGSYRTYLVALPTVQGTTLAPSDVTTSGLTLRGVVTS